MHGNEGGETGLDDGFARRAMEGFGAFILSRNMFGPVRGDWPDDQWRDGGVFRQSEPRTLFSRSRATRRDRRQTPGGSAQAAASPAVLRANAILRNTLEQVVFAAGSHCALAVELPAGWMVVLPGLVGLLCVGRALFWLGYRHGADARAFGFALTFYPSVGAFVAAIALLFY